MEYLKLKSFADKTDELFIDINTKKLEENLIGIFSNITFPVQYYGLFHQSLYYLVESII